MLAAVSRLEDFWPLVHSSWHLARRPDPMRTLPLPAAYCRGSTRRHTSRRYSRQRSRPMTARYYSALASRRHGTSAYATAAGNAAVGQFLYRSDAGHTVSSVKPYYWHILRHAMRLCCRRLLRGCGRQAAQPPKRRVRPHIDAGGGSVALMMAATYGLLFRPPA